MSYPVGRIIELPHPNNLSTLSLIFQRLEMLYRPSYQRQGLSTVTRAQRSSEVILTNFTNNSLTGNTLPPASDPPPKYTPPPSYSTARGARIARMLRQSFRRSVRRLQGAAGDTRSKGPPPPDYVNVVIETARYSAPNNGASTSHNIDEVYIDPHDTVLLEMRPTNTNLFNTTANIPAEQLGAYSLDLNLPTLQRRSIRRNSERPSQQPQQQPEHPHGRVVALGVGALHRADSEAVLVEDAEPINIDSGSEIYTAVSEISIEVTDVNDDQADRDDDGNDHERVRSSAEIEAVNVHVRQSSTLSSLSNVSQQPVVTIDMDTSTSVI